MTNPIQSNLDGTGGYIPYPLRAQINQINPRLDVFWQERLTEIFSTIGAEDARNASEQLLAPKQIFWNKTTQKFEYDGQNLPFDEWIRQIPASVRDIKMLAVRLTEMLPQLSSYTDFYQIADFLDNILSQIQKVGARHDMESQIWKSCLHEQFIYAAASHIRQNNHFSPLQGVRRLAIPCLKTYACEVYLKQQLLGYRFKTLRNRELAEMPQSLFNGFLREEERSRQLEVVRASKYLFAIAPTLEFAANPYLFRRFLTEEKLYGNKILLNGAAVNTALLGSSGNDEQKVQREQHFKAQIERIITVESNVSRMVVDFMNRLEDYHDENIIPLLFAPFPADTPDLSAAVDVRLAQCGKLVHIMQPLRDALKRIANNEDEYEYIYRSSRRLFSAMTGVFQDFLTLPAVLMHTGAATMSAKTAAYTALLQKRHSQVFAAQDDAQWAEHSRAKDEPLNRLYAISLKTAADDLKAQLEKPATLLDKLLGRRKTRAARLERAQKEIREIQHSIHKELRTLPKAFPEQMVYLEADAQLIADETKRHYAFARGDNGITELPLLLPLPENPYYFDLGAFAAELERGAEQNIAEYIQIQSRRQARDKKRAERR